MKWKNLIKKKSNDELEIIKGEGFCILLKENDTSYILIKYKHFEDFNRKELPYPDFDRDWIESNKNTLELVCEFNNQELAMEKFEEESKNYTPKNSIQEENLPEVIPAKSLPNGWHWKQFGDLSGCLESPTGISYFSYDWDTFEYQVNEGDDYSYFGNKDDDGNKLTFGDFKNYAEEYIAENIIKQYAKCLLNLLKEQDICKEVKPNYILTFLKDENCNKYDIFIGINAAEKLEKNQINFLYYSEFNNMSNSEQKKFMGDSYNASILGKTIDEFTFEEAKKDFFEVCNFNYLPKGSKEEER